MEASVAQRGSYIYKDQDHPAHLSRDDLSLVLSSEHCGSLKVSQVTGITYSWERAQVYVVGKPHRNMRQPGEVVWTPCLRAVSVYLPHCPPMEQSTGLS